LISGGSAANCWSFGSAGGSAAASVARFFFRDHFDRLSKLLVCYRARRIDHLRPLEFACCALQVAAIPHFDAAFNMHFARIEAYPV